MIWNHQYFTSKKRDFSNRHRDLTNKHLRFNPTEMRICRHMWYVLSTIQPQGVNHVNASTGYVSAPTYPLVNVNKKLWKITIFNGKIHYFDWVIFNSYVTNYQRVPVMILLACIRDSADPFRTSSASFFCFLPCDAVDGWPSSGPISRNEKNNKLFLSIFEETWVESHILYRYLSSQHYMQVAGG